MWLTINFEEFYNHPILLVISDLRVIWLTTSHLKTFLFTFLIGSRFRLTYNCASLILIKKKNMTTRTGKAFEGDGGDGATRVTGWQGWRGWREWLGDKGDEGDGVTRVTRVTGWQGWRGWRGDKGDKGDKGEKSDKGDRGDGVVRLTRGRYPTSYLECLSHQDSENIAHC